VNAKLDLPVLKMHGTENTFILVDERPAVLDDYAGLARRLCAHDGELGGADGLLVIRDAPGFAAEMQIYNADGTRAEMCGNGVRCVARYLAERGAGDQFRISTLAGPIEARVTSREPFEVCVDVGPVRFPNDAREETVTTAGSTWSFYDVSVGNPHAVIFVDDVNAVDVSTLGVTLNWLERFAPHGTNVHVVDIVDDATLRARHYERGVGLTQACGTGAVACAAAAVTVRGVTSPVTVIVPGGTLRVEWKPGESARLTGPAETIFERTLVP
jgi:diaminopimelate epimerase